MLESGGKSSGKSNDQKVNKGFLKKIPDNAEAALVLEGQLPGLLRPLSVFIRLEKAAVLPTLPEVDVPTRFGMYFQFTPNFGDYVSLRQLPPGSCTS